jgi:hypothetical protein
MQWFAIGHSVSRFLLPKQASQAVGAIAFRRRRPGAGQRRQQAAPARLIRMLAGATGKLLLTGGALRHSVYPLNASACCTRGNGHHPHIGVFTQHRYAPLQDYWRARHT